MFILFIIFFKIVGMNFKPMLVAIRMCFMPLLVVTRMHITPFLTTSSIVF